ncbi:heme ABC exporter ATP-binding protein CcmA [Nocardioides sp. NPDC051685]|uniref:heme ABC exporter ATP-binding protein CcmA n=1 Tax=Nocardioides sp. NPDC051685 TaxID=3364334 RepID=UPI00378DB167
MNNVVELSGLRVVRGKREVLHDLDFSIRAGEVTGLLGPSGCGKTTLMRALVGVQAKVTGTVTVHGEPAGSASLRSRIGYVTQESSVYNDLTITENLRFFAKVLGVPSSSVAAAIETVDLVAYADQVVRDLSGGQQSRVSLAAALLGSPSLLVLDEPTVGLDPVLREQLWGTFRTLAEDGAAVIVSSHVMDEADRCDRLLLMREGAILADGSPAEIKQKANADDIEHAFLTLVREGGR